MPAAGRVALVVAQGAGSPFDMPLTVRLEKMN